MLTFFQVGGDNGAGLTALALSTFHALNPKNWSQKMNTYKQHMSRKDKLTDEEKNLAQLAKESYNPHEKRNHIQSANPYQYDADNSGRDYAVYHREADGQKKHYLVFKGTSDSKDILPDTAIAFGYQSRNQGFSDAQDIYNQLSNKFQDGSWETVGHSLGGTKAMYIAERNKLQSHAFNPGYNNYLDDELNPGYEGHNIYIRKKDPISNTMLTENLANVKVLDSVSNSAVANHSIDNF